MERRVLIAVFLSFLVLYGYQTLFVPPPPPTTETPGGAAPGAATPAAETPAQSPAPVAEPPAPAIPDTPVVVGDTAEREIVVETATTESSLTNRGGRITHWRLKQYRDRQGQPVDLVPSALAPDTPTPFSLRVDDEAITRQLNSALYQVMGDAGNRVDARTGEGMVVFEFQTATLRARKEFRFDPANYLITFTASVENNGQPLNPAVVWGPGLGDIGARASGGSFFTGNYVQPPQGIYHRDGDVERITGNNLVAQPVHEGVFRFAGIDDHYFLAAALNPGQARVEFKPTPIAGPNQTQRQLLAETITF